MVLGFFAGFWDVLLLVLLFWFVCCLFVYLFVVGLFVFCFGFSCRSAFDELLTGTRLTPSQVPRWSLFL